MTLRETSSEYLRGLVGGGLFAIPLLMTREVWRAGFLSHPSRLLVGVLGGFALLILFNFVAGIRDDESWGDAIKDSFEEYALGILLAGVVFALTARIQPDDSLPQIAGMLAVGAITCSLGVSVGTAQLGENPAKKIGKDFPTQFLIAVCGAVIVGGNIGPTLEVASIAEEIGPWHEIGLLLFTMILIWVTAAYAHLKGHTDFSARPPIPKTPFTMFITLLAAFVATVPTLWFFGRYDDGGFRHNVSQTVVMLFPAALGAVVARALLQVDGASENS